MKQIYLARMFFTFGNTAVSLFLPLYLYQLHVSLSWIFLSYAIVDGVHALLVVPTGHVIRKFGLPAVFGMGIVGTIAFYVGMLIYDPTNPYVLFGLSVFFGVANVLYWNAWHCMLAFKSSKGSELSHLKSIASITNVVAPVAGGFIITYLGFPAMFTIFCCVMMLSVIPIGIITVWEYGESNPTPTLKEIIAVSHWRDSVAMGIGFIDNNIENIVWPLFLGSVGILSILSIGSLYTGISVAMIFITPILGKLIDRSESKTLIFSSIGMFAMGVLRVIGFAAPITNIGITFVSEVFSTAENSTIDHLCYQRAREKDVFAYIMFREIIINIGTTIFFLICAATQNYTIMFIIGALSSTTYVFFLRKDDAYYYRKAAQALAASAAPPPTQIWASRSTLEALGINILEEEE